MTEVAVIQYRKQVPIDNSSFDAKKLRYRISNAEFEKSWGNDYEKPRFSSRVLSAIIRIVPKIGPLKALVSQDAKPRHSTGISSEHEFHRGSLQSVTGTIEKPVSQPLQHRSSESGS